MVPPIARTAVTASVLQYATCFRVIVPADEGLWGHNVGQRVYPPVRWNDSFRTLSKKMFSSIYFKLRMCAYWVSVPKQFDFRSCGQVLRFIDNNWNVFIQFILNLAGVLIMWMFWIVFFLRPRCQIVGPLLSVRQQNTHLKILCLLLVLEQSVGTVPSTPCNLWLPLPKHIKGTKSYVKHELYSVESLHVTTNFNLQYFMCSLFYIALP